LGNKLTLWNTVCMCIKFENLWKFGTNVLLYFFNCISILLYLFCISSFRFFAFCRVLMIRVYIYIPDGPELKTWCRNICDWRFSNNQNKVWLRNMKRYTHECKSVTTLNQLEQPSSVFRTFRWCGLDLDILCRWE